MEKEKKGSWILFIVVSIVAVFFLAPVYFSVINAFKTNGQIMRDATSFPTTFYVKSFITLWSKTRFPEAIRNSILLTVIAESLIIIVVPIGAYALERSKTKLSNWIYIYFIAGMMIPFQSYMIPLFKQLKVLHLFGTYAGPIVIYVSGATAFGTLLFTSFLKGIPEDIEEAAQIDGCSNFMIFWKIVFPLLSPCTASLIILNGLQIWNDFLMPMLVLPSDKAKTINVEIFSFIGEFASRWDIVFAGVICGIIPVLVIFIFLQRYFVKGITAGAAKG
jgi:raffinose/stachyose/melibiose transport system permease protein